jgi:Uncharacterised nucleotidyltransferase
VIAELPTSLTGHAHAECWARVYRRLAENPTVDGLAAHRLVLVGERAGLLPPDPRVASEHLLSLARLHSVRRTLEAARAAIDGDVVLFKGLAVASRYPSPECRPFGDIDLLVDDAPRAHRQLLDAGFVPCAPVANAEAHFAGLQHLEPLMHPDHGRVPVEVHRHVSWVSWLKPPSTAEVMAASQVADIGVSGFREPAPAHHALIVTAHSAATLPLRHLGDLVDAMLLADESTELEIQALARRWGVLNLWRTYRAVIDQELLVDGPPPRPAQRLRRRLLTPNFAGLRDATVLESHLRRWFGPWWIRKPLDRLPASAVAVGHDLLPAPNETWANKRHRIAAAIQHRDDTLSEHLAELGPGHVQPRLKRRRGLG